MLDDLSSNSNNPILNFAQVTDVLSFNVISVMPFLRSPVSSMTSTILAHLKFVESASDDVVEKRQSARVIR